MWRAGILRKRITANKKDSCFQLGTNFVKNVSTFFIQTPPIWLISSNDKNETGYFQPHLDSLL